MSARKTHAKKSARPGATKPAGSPARDLAWSAVLAAIERGGFVGDLLAERRDAAELSPRDAALASTIARSAVRHCFTIDALLARVAQYDARRVPPGLRAVLYVAATQIVYLDRIPVSAAVNEAVSQARRVESAGAARMANAVLRRLGDAIVEHRTAWRDDRSDLVRVSWSEACRFDREVFGLDAREPDELARLADLTATPRGLLAEMRPHVSPAELAALAWAGQAQPATTLHRNPLKLDAAEFERRVRDADPTAEVVGDTAFVAGESVALVLSLLRAGEAYVQDPTAHEIALELRPRSGERILDYCAAPGGKSFTLAFSSNDTVAIVATDRAAARLRALRQQVEQLGLESRIRVVAMDRDGSVSEDAPRGFDAAIVDVPCSNTGVLARRPEARFRLDAAHLRSLRETQLAALARAARHVGVGGRLIYSTCSIRPEENGELIRAWLRGSGEPSGARTDGWAFVRERLHLPRWGATPKDWRDGGYFAELVRER